MLRTSARGNRAPFVRGGMKFPVIFLVTSGICLAQTLVQGARGQNVPDRPGPTLEQPEAPAPAFAFKVVTRLVILEIVARDREDNPVRDLTAGEFRIAERIGKSGELPQKVSYFRAVDSSVPRGQPEGIVLGAPQHTAFCGSSGAYELSYYLSSESRKDGWHRIFVTSSRRHLKLYFRQGYQVDAEHSVKQTSAAIGDESRTSSHDQAVAAKSADNLTPSTTLATIACYDTLDALSLPLSVRRITSGPESAKYEFVVPGKSLVFFPTADHTHRVQLDLAICTFKFNGFPQRSLGGTMQESLTESDYQEVLAQGFAHEIEFAPNGAATARLVVREVTTGALGSVELKLADLLASDVRIPEGTPVSSFGTTTPIPSALCGDVYNLSPSTTQIPWFSGLDSLAAIYTTSLGINSPFFTEGIPGATSRDEWFGVDYQGAFGIDEPGAYEFELTSDDGAKLYVDDHLIINNDGIHLAKGTRGKLQLDLGNHRIRVAYFQGPRVGVALIVLIKPPGKRWRLFDTRDYPRAEDPRAHRQKLKPPSLQRP